MLMKGYKKYFRKLIGQFYSDRSNYLVKEIDLAFEQIREDVRFASLSANPLDKRMEIAGYFLATIRVLDKEGEHYDRIREVLIEIAREYVRPRNKFQSFMKRLPAKLVNSPLAALLLRQLDKRTREKGYPDGFVARVITDKKETLGFGYGFDILECGICKLFAKHNYKKYAPILCEVDYITSGLAGLRLIRTGTIANGAEKCDFRFEKIK